MTTATAGQWPREIVFHAYPRLIFAWPIILLGFLLYPLDAWGLVRPDILAWLWGSTLFVVILTLGVHVNRNLSLFWAVLGSAAWLLGIYLRDVRGFAPLAALLAVRGRPQPAVPASCGAGVQRRAAGPLSPLLGGGPGRREVGAHALRGGAAEEVLAARVPAAGRAHHRRPIQRHVQVYLRIRGGSLRILDREGNLLREIRWVFFLPRVRQRIDEIVEVAPVAALAAS